MMLSGLAQSALNALAREGLVWTGDTSVGATTPMLANWLRIRRASRQRAALNEELTYLRKQGFVHFEFNRDFDREVRWTITRKGLDRAQVTMT